MRSTNETTPIFEYAKSQIQELVNSFPELDFTPYREKVEQAVLSKENMSDENLCNSLILSALERVSAKEPNWTYVAAKILVNQLYRKAAHFRKYDSSLQYGSFYELVQQLTRMGIYSEKLLQEYSKEELEEVEQIIVPNRDLLFTYVGLLTFADRYLAKSHSGEVYELPQERFLLIALTLMMKESKEKRLGLVKEVYWAISNLYMTVATPTLANAGKSYGQLSSCFIDTVDDSLRGIYDSNTDIATLSKSGGGIGTYLGKLRSRGSNIKGFKGVSSGVIPWMKQLNNTAVSVDQLGQRQGAVSVYLDIWHRDIYSFLAVKLNNGDERQRTHDLFTGVCIPDLFMEKVEVREEWYLFDPHSIRQTLGFSLEDYYDEERGAGNFRDKYRQCVEAANSGLLGEKGLVWDVVPAIDIFKEILKSQLETGTPYMFYRDTVNRANANRHQGMIYCSNLCTEITQNMKATTVIEEKTEDGKIIIVKEPGDFVVCNLSSINLAKAVTENVLERLIPIQVRMLDNVIDLNNIPVPQAQITNQKYRSIGLGTFGWHHLLALKGIKWESEEAVEYADLLYEEIAFLTIGASNELATEKGAYPLFDGSDWATGEYFNARQYTSGRWKKLRQTVKESGVRNGYLMAVAPNSTTAIIAGTTASIDPIFKKEYSEEKKNYKIPVTAPDLSSKTTWYYKSAYEIDQIWSIKQNEVRQKHIDQSISFNLYVKNTIKAKDLLHIHLEAWKANLKTTYYTRSTSMVEIEECESCSS